MALKVTDGYVLRRRRPPTKHRLYRFFKEGQAVRTKPWQAILDDMNERQYGDMETDSFRAFQRNSDCETKIFRKHYKGVTLTIDNGQYVWAYEWIERMPFPRSHLPEELFDI